MGSVAGGLQLQGGVPDVEVPGQAGMQLIEQPGRVAVGEAGVVDGDVRGQGGQPGGEGYTCRSWTSRTCPDRIRWARTSSRSMPSGAAYSTTLWVPMIILSRPLTWVSCGG